MKFCDLSLILWDQVSFFNSSVLVTAMSLGSHVLSVSHVKTYRDVCQFFVRNPKTWVPFVRRCLDCPSWTHKKKKKHWQQHLKKSCSCIRVATDDFTSCLFWLYHSANTQQNVKACILWAQFRSKSEEEKLKKLH